MQIITITQIVLFLCHIPGMDSSFPYTVNVSSFKHCPSSYSINLHLITLLYVQTPWYEIRSHRIILVDNVKSQFSSIRFELQPVYTRVGYWTWIKCYVTRIKFCPPPYCIKLAVHGSFMWTSTFWEDFPQQSHLMNKIGDHLSSVRFLLQPVCNRVEYWTWIKCCETQMKFWPHSYCIKLPAYCNFMCADTLIWDSFTQNHPGLHYKNKFSSIRFELRPVKVAVVVCQ